jgi:hypothetical protein
LLGLLSFSSCVPALAFLFPLGKGPRVDHKCSILRVKDKNHLQPAVTVTATDNAPLAIFSGLRIGAPCVVHDQLRLFGGDTMFGDVLHVPLIPSEFHDTLPTEYFTI